MQEGKEEVCVYHESGKGSNSCAGACNLSGVVHAFSAIVDTLCAEARRRGKGTDWVNRHAISKLFCDKMADLSGARSFEDFSQAYAECRKLADGQSSSASQ